MKKLIIVAVGIAGAGWLFYKQRSKNDRALWDEATDKV